MENVKSIIINGITFTNENDLHNFLKENGYFKSVKYDEIKDEFINNLNFKAQTIEFESHENKSFIKIKHEEFKELDLIVGFIGNYDIHMFNTIDEFIDNINNYNDHTYEVINKFNKIGINVYPKEWEFCTDYTNSSIVFGVENGGQFNYDFNDEKLESIIKLLSGENVIAKMDVSDNSFKDTLIVGGNPLFNLVPRGYKVEIKIT